MAYATQMEAARNSVITKEMEAAAAKEGIAPAELMRQMAEGRAIIPCNKLHKSISPSAWSSRRSKAPSTWARRR